MSLQNFYFLDWMLLVFSKFLFVTLVVRALSKQQKVLKCMLMHLDPSTIFFSHSFRELMAGALWYIIQETPLLSKLFLVPINKKVYFAKLRRNWNVSMCVEKHIMHDLQRERPIRSSA